MFSVQFTEESALALAFGFGFSFKFRFQLLRFLGGKTNIYIILIKRIFILNKNSRSKSFFYKKHSLHYTHVIAENKVFNFSFNTLGSIHVLHILLNMCKNTLTFFNLLQNRTGYSYLPLFTLEPLFNCLLGTLLLFGSILFWKPRLLCIYKR